ncbi:FAD binding domain [Teratosphaeria destructans]|uniref:FAD binding domain n=1 Tax=Teratosphaeria destructans TaxID=418781 RepID=A0A9W7T0M0_9PEZI|nr:FAD binding domain [Teratosphaeria destructans]
MKVTGYYEDNGQGNLVFGGQSKGIPCGRSIFPAAWPLEMAMAAPVVKEVFGLVNGKCSPMQGRLVSATHTMCLSYIDREGQNGLTCWCLTSMEPDRLEAQSTVESWTNAVPAEDVLQTMTRVPGWNHAMVRLVKTMPEGSHHLLAITLEESNPMQTFAFRASAADRRCRAPTPTHEKTMAKSLSRRTVCFALIELLGFYNAEVYHKNDAAEMSGNA